MYIKNKKFDNLEGVDRKNVQYTKHSTGVQLQIFLLFLLLFIAYALRVNMSVAIVAMVDKNSEIEVFNWSSSTQSLILSSFFWGYVILQVPAGPLAIKFGPKLLLLIAIFICSILNVITPLCAKIGGWGLLCGVRGLQGLAQGFVFPCTHHMLSSWAPIAERGRLSAFCYAGTQLGTVFMLFVSGFIADSKMKWPGIFYISGLLGIIWCFIFYCYGGNAPSNLKGITEAEKNYIENFTASDSKNVQKKSIPWKSIFSSVPVWTIVIAHCGHNWGYTTLLTNIPTYMKQILEFDIKSNALLSALPYFASWILSILLSFIADFFINKKYIKLATSRKVFNSLGQYIPMIMMIALGYIDKENRNIAVILLTIAVGFNAGTYVGFMVNHLDLSPNFAGTLMGLSNFGGNIVSIIAPLAVGFLTNDMNDPVQWRLVFFISAGIYLLTNSIFVVFGRASVQHWNNYDI